MDIKEAGRKGGIAGSLKMSKKKRSERARNAAAARWRKFYERKAKLARTSKR